MNIEKKCFSEQWEKDAAVAMWVDIMNRIVRCDDRQLSVWKKEFICKWNDIHNSEAQISWGNNCPLCDAFECCCTACPLKVCSESHRSLCNSVCTGKQNEALEAAHTILGHILAMPVEPVDVNKYVVIFSKEMRSMFVNPEHYEEGDKCIRIFEGTQDECRKWVEEHEKFRPVMAFYYCDGKQLQSRSKVYIDAEWEDDDYPDWNNQCVEFRVKPEKKWRPFKDIQELKHTWLHKRYNLMAILNPLEEPEIWVRSKSNTTSTYLITHFCGNVGVVHIYSTLDTSLEQLYEDFTFLDGTPCGVEE